jgi:dCMP deaminase
MTRPEKYDWMEHAERNTIYNAARLGISTLNSVMYATMRPCSACARAIAQAGISTVYYPKGAYPQGDAMKWKADWMVSEEIFKEAKVTVVQLESVNGLQQRETSASPAAKHTEKELSAYRPQESISHWGILKV